IPPWFLEQILLYKTIKPCDEPKMNKNFFRNFQFFLESLVHKLNQKIVKDILLLFHVKIKSNIMRAE
ncbi:MAG TPA: hypothetical protein DF698_00030, partial [Candidatus Atribacteria bacterium]|nr:hypothetical protein [Candidatus Atribacteria bacterium]